MPVLNRYRTTLLSFLAYFIVSGMLAPIGIISTPMAQWPRLLFLTGFASKRP